MNNILVKAKHNNAPISPKKVTPVMNLIRGKFLYDAKVTLALDSTKASKILLKVLKSAESNAKNKNLNSKDLLVTDLWVGNALTLKGGHATARGRWAPHLKRFSNIFVGLNERIVK